MGRAEVHCDFAVGYVALEEGRVVERIRDSLQKIVASHCIGF